MQTLFFNGKFTAQRTTGVQRYARQMIQAFDALKPADEAWRGVLLCPPQGQAPALQRTEVRRVGLAGLPLHAWEQIVLPWHARSGLLLNLAGSSPLLARRQWCTFHDAAVFDHPEAYTRRFSVYYRGHFRWLARRAERLLTVSQHSRGRLASRLGMPAAAIALVPNGGDHLLAVAADPTVVDRLGLRGCRWLLAVGSENPLKNWAALRAAWRQLDKPQDLRLVLVGGRDPSVFARDATPDADSAAGWFEPRGEADVLHAGTVSDAALKALYGGALALVFPSRDEGFGLPPLEAMSLGCPVAVSNAGAMPEVCGDDALYFDPCDVQSIAAALQRLLREPALRERLAASGPARARQLDWASSARALQQLLAGAGGRV